MIGHQVHLNAFAYLSGYGQSDCGCSHLEMSKYIYECCDVEVSHIEFNLKSAELFGR
jgi:hypothetical protein